MYVRGFKRMPSSRGGGGDEPTICKRRKTDVDDGRFGRGAPEAPAELFRKDLISAMKLPDSEPLAANEFWVITDPWKQEWERGVQVPVNPDSLPEPAVTVIPQYTSTRNDFKLPKQKYVRLTQDSNFNTNEHCLSNATTRAEAACAYDMDACDAAWLRALNGERARAGVQPLHEEQLERVIEELEVRCWEKIQSVIKSEEGLGIEYDENVICDVCRSPDSEEGNEMVFCDSCNICVHQACYGITTIPSGQWLCSPCAGSVRPVCVLCPNLGGAMKCTPSGHKWAHVSCVLWIPEVSIGCAEKMEPITKISAIPPSRWSLLCILCRERTGACIQCSVRTCKTAYHVTCAFKYGLEMRAIIEDENADDGVKLRSYCQKHSVTSKKDRGAAATAAAAASASDEDDGKRRRRKDMTSEEKTQARALRVHEIEAEFDRHVSVKDVSARLLDVDPDGIQYMYNYWKLKRKAAHNRPLLAPKSEESDALAHRQEQADIDKRRMFVQLRQDLERVRNLCYMVGRREKLSRSFIRLREQTFHKQASILSHGHPLSPAVLNAVLEANHGPSIYDRLYSHAGATDHTADFDNILSLIGSIGSEDESRKDLNGLVRRSKANAKQSYCNGSVQRMGSCGWLSSDADSMPERELHKQQQQRYRKPIYSTTDDDEPEQTVPTTKKVLMRSKNADNNGRISNRKKTRQTPPSKAKIESSSEEDAKNRSKDERPNARSTLRQLENEMGAGSFSESESDELVPIRATKNYRSSKNIYSDSDGSDNFKNEDVNEDKSSNATSDSQQHPVRTKAAVKEFIPISKGVTKGTAAKRLRSIGGDEERKRKDTHKTKDYPSDLIVPQRKAAKKASENMRSTTAAVKSKDQNEMDPKSVQAVDEVKLKSKQKFKEKRKESKDVSPKDLKKEPKFNTLSSALVDFEKEPQDKDNLDLLAYVPQRQAAKKAAEHIKSGLSKVPEAPADDFTKKKELLAELQKKSPRKEEDKKQKPIKSSSSSSSSGSSGSYSSSSSDCEKDVKPTVSKISDKRVSSKYSFSPPRRVTADLPFLDKGPKVISSSSDSETAKETPPKPYSNRLSPRGPRRKKSVTPPPSGSTKPSGSTPRKTSDKKLKSSDGLPDSGAYGSSSEREKSSRAGSTMSRTSTRTRTRSITSGPRNISDRKDSGIRKSDREESVTASYAYKESKEDRESAKLSSAEWKTDKKLKHSKQSESVYQKKSDARLIDDSRKESSKSTGTKHEKYSVKTEKLFGDSSNNNKHKNAKKTDYFGDSTCDEETTPKSTPKKSYEQKRSEPSERRSIFSPEHTPEEFKRENSKIMPRALHSVVKSPKTPLESDKTNEPCEGQTMKLHELKDRSKRKISLDTSENTAPNESASVKSNEIQETSTNKSNKSNFLPPAYNRSLFSPAAGKDTGGSDVFDFCNDMLAVDETMSDDGFNISQGSEIMKNTSLTFFSSDFFKEDSKEDRGVPETLHLVEKLRMKLDSKKTGVGNQDDNAEPEVSDIKEQDKSLPSTLDSDKSYKKSESSDDSKEENLLAEKSDAKDTEPQNISFDLSKSESQQSLDIGQESLQSSKEELEEKSATENSPNASYNVDSNKSSQYNVEHSPHENIDSSRHMRIEATNQMGISKSVYLNTDKRYENQMNMPSGAHSTDMHSGARLYKSTPEPVEPEKLKEYREFDFTREQMQKLEAERMMPQSECASIRSPYLNIQHQQKWSESELIPARRSSMSSTASETSSTSHKQDDGDHARPAENMQPHPMMQNMGYSMQPYQMCPIDSSYNQFSSEASQFVGGPVPMFPPSTINSDIPMQAAGPTLFPPNINIAYHPHGALMAQMPKISEEPMAYSAPCSAAFTSSSHNMALTTSMVGPLTPKPMGERDVPHEGGREMAPSSSFDLREPPLPSIDDYLNTTLKRPRPEATEKQPAASTVSPLQDKKSPSKPSRSSARFTPQQMKSPCKSPKSPKHVDVHRGPSRGRGGQGRGSRGGRGRGRGSRGGKSAQNLHAFPTLGYYPIDNLSTLRGTVYDFSEENPNNSMSDLKSMRERRRSTDVHERKGESYRDSSQSPKFASPPQHSAKRSFIPELRPPSPIANLAPSAETPASPAVLAAPAEGVRPFTDIVQPVLPGPVDRYSAFEPSNADPFNKHLLGAFDSETADQPLADIDEEEEKTLHSALQASSNKTLDAPKVMSPAKKPAAEAAERIVEEPPYEPPCTPKVSLTDPRNQLKVKIKGPFLDANYLSYIPPVVQQPSAPVVEQPQVVGTPSAVGSVSSGMPYGTLRMRKKELLRQYCTQDMNMDDPTSGSVNDAAPPPPVAAFSRNVITIPKAVASMTSIPTREDYKAVVDANMEKKRRKVSGGARHFDYDGEPHDNESTSSSLTTTGQMALSYKRRGRAPKPAAPAPAAAAATPPKIKIKFGGTGGGGNYEPPAAAAAEPRYDFQFRPPKKRLASMPKPNVEDMKRELLKFREQVFADFEEGDKEKRKDRKSKGDRAKKKKRERRPPEMHVVDKRPSESNSTKLIIRIRKKDDAAAEESGSSSSSAAPGPSEPRPAEDPFEYDPAAPDPLALDAPGPSKVSPIRLKLSSRGSGYVMKESPGGAAPAGPAGEEAAAGGNVSLEAAAASSNADHLNSSIAHSKHCEVR